MKKVFSFFLPICLLSLTCCKDASPVAFYDALFLRANDEESGLIWNRVRHASKYMIEVNEEDPYYVTEPGFLFREEEGYFEIKISAIVGDKKVSTESFRYTSRMHGDATIYYNSYESLLSAQYFQGKELYYRYADWGYMPFDLDAPIEITTFGHYIFKITHGLVCDEYGYYTYYLKDYCFVYCLGKSAAYSEQLVLEDGSESSDADLTNKYQIKEQTESGEWTSTSNASVKLNNEGLDGKCVEFDYKDDGKFYKFAMPFSVNTIFGKLLFSLKASSSATVRFVLSTNKTLPILDGVDLPPISSIYTYIPSTTWNDPYTYVAQSGWTFYINNEEVPYYNVDWTMQRTYHILYPVKYYLLPFFDTFEIQVKGNGNSGETCQLHLDNLILEGV